MPAFAEVGFEQMKIRNATHVWNDNLAVNDCTVYGGVTEVLRNCQELIGPIKALPGEERRSPPNDVSLNAVAIKLDLVSPCIGFARFRLGRCAYLRRAGLDEAWHGGARVRATRSGYVGRGVGGPLSNDERSIVFRKTAAPCSGRTRNTRALAPVGAFSAAEP